MAEGVIGPFRRFVGVAGCAGVGDLVLLCGGRRNEFEGVRADESVRRAFGFDLRHVTSDAGAARAAFHVVRVFFDRRGARAIGRLRTVAIEAKLLGGLAQLRVIAGAVNVVAVETGDAARIHHALHKIVALHAVFVGSAFREVIEIGLSEVGLFELPVIAQIAAGVVSDRPIVMFAFDRIIHRAALGMALDAGVGRSDVIQ